MPLRDRARDVASEAVSRVRDRRRKERQRLEELFDRKTFVSVAFLGSGSKVMETLVVPIIAAEPVEWNVAGAWLVTLCFSVVVAVYWKELKESASDAADAASDAVDSDGPE